MKALKLAVILVLLLPGLLMADDDDDDEPESVVEIVTVLLPDGISLSDPRVVSWQDASSEEGIRLRFLTESRFIAMGENTRQLKNLVLPDQVYQIMTDTVVNAIKNYVSRGGKLMLVYDAGALTTVNGNPVYPIPGSRFSELVGVDYVLYDKYGAQTIGFGSVLGTEKTLWSLQVPPGKSMPFPQDVSLLPEYLISSEYTAGGVENLDSSFYENISTGRLRSDDLPSGVFIGTESESDEVRLSDRRSNEEYSRYSSGSDTAETYSRYESSESDDDRRDDAPSIMPVQASNDIYGITGYVYGFLNYPSFVTEGNYGGKALLASPQYGLVAGVNQFGNGQVLFVNLPLSYLKGQTDGMLMHGFLHYLTSDMLSMPRLASQPNGKGGLVLNWHVDSAEALDPMMQLGLQGVWNEGPFSIHVTAGPDVVAFGDGLGLDVQNNKLAQDWIRYFETKGHKVGTHGGWIHDYYGDNAPETYDEEFENYLVWNKQVLEKYLEDPITEYSAPSGNNPKWAVDWVEKNNMVGYYFAGHTGMGPTRTYREGVLMNPKLWAFPVSTLGEYATFEEFEEYGVPETDLNRWLSALVDFSVNNHTSRLIYFHPPGAVDFSGVVNNLMLRARYYAGNNKFKWYTMTELSRFMTSRQQVSWTVEPASYGYENFRMTHPSTLRSQTMLLPKVAYSKPSIRSGYAQVLDGGSEWMVVAGSGTLLRFTARRNN